jgi:nicotinate phosphoribosyltransferase
VQTSGLCTDLYELRMAASYLRRGMTAPATFSLFVRKLPADRGFLVAAGLDSCLEDLASLGFDEEALGYLRDDLGFPAADVEALAGLRFTGDVRAVPEGTLLFADEPLLEVTAPLPEAQLVETLVLNRLTFATTVASKAARCRLAAPHATLVDFAARRAQGLDAALTVARASVLAGFDATSYVEAARRFDLTAVGTMAHSYIQAFDDELAAFRAFATDFPRQAVFLVDTYATDEGLEHAVRVARELDLEGEAVGVRIDSGDLAAQARAARRVLDSAGLHHARIMASGGLDEHLIARLVDAGAPIDAYGVGTRMGVSWDAPSLDSAYKLVAYRGRPALKLSAGKATLPGPKQVFRSPSRGDVLALADESPPGPDFVPMLSPVMRGGVPVQTEHGVGPARQRATRGVAMLPDECRSLAGPRPLPVRRSAALTALTARLAASPVRSERGLDAARGEGREDPVP